MSSAGPPLKVGDTVLIQGRHIGEVKFIGTTGFDPSGREWIGVELERPIGKHDGKVKERRYFRATPKHGTFVARVQCEPYTEEKAAARKIQAAARAKIARKRVEQEVSWQSFNMLDNQEENLHLRRRNRLLQAGLRPLAPEKQTAAGRERIMKEVDAMEVEAEYTGPRLSFPLDRDQVMRMIEFFKGGGRLHYKYVMQLLDHFAREAGAKPTMVRTTVNDGERLAVVGDTHGQLQDLYSIFTINGVPTATNRYIFNGDFVDRGAYGVEVVLTLMAFHLALPDSCLLNRGNHEERSQNETQGFLTEVLNKYNGAPYGDHGRGLRVYESFHSAFDNLPLATLISKNGRKVFVVHGGLFDRNQNVQLSHIEAIKRKREIPWGRENFEDRVFEDMMWSDPRQDISGTEPSTRGAGVFFGPDVTERFCALNGISLVIRSHECVREGFLYQHGDRCLTIFSASRYCGTGVNNGAFIVFDHELTNVVQQFMAIPLTATEPKVLDEGKTAEPYVASPTPKLEEVDHTPQDDVVRQMIIERIILKKSDLFWYFSNADKDNTGSISRLEWAEAMRTVLQMPDLQWMRLSHSLVDPEPDGTINYAKFLDRYRIEMREEDTAWQERVIERVCERLFRLCCSLEEAYKIFDVNDDGRIEYSEFVAAMERLDVGLTRPQIYELMRSMDTDRDSHIDFSEFASRFRVVFTRLRDEAGGVTAAEALRDDGEENKTEQRADLESIDEWSRATLHRVGTHLFAGGLNAAQVFERMDTDKDNAVSADEFYAALNALELDPALSHKEVRRLMDAIDTNQSGMINYVEFLDAFKIVDIGAAPGSNGSSPVSSPRSDGSGGSTGSGTKGRNWQRAVIEQVVSVLYEYRIELQSAFEKFDLDHSGTVSAEEFRLGLRALTGALGSPLTDMQADELLKVLDKNGDGQLSYSEFVSGFRVVDTKKEGEERPAKRRDSAGSAKAKAGAGAP